MADIKVKFLGKEYTFPEELKQYVAYCNQFEKISENLSDALLNTMHRHEKSSDSSAGAADIEESLKVKMRGEAKKVIAMLAKHGIYDTTERDLVDNNKGYIYYQKVYETMMDGLTANLRDNIKDYMDGMEDAQRSAYSQVTGTGISMYSSSLIAHMTLAAFETSAVKKQCAKADRDYDRAMDALSKKASSQREQKDAKVMIEAFSGVATAFGLYVSELMDKFLNKLQQHSVYNYALVKPYSIQRSSELLNNLSLVDDKLPVLEQAFLNCPYNPDIYAKILELGLTDVDSFMTAKEFYQDIILRDIIQDYCLKNSQDIKKIKNPVTVLAKYENVDITAVFQHILHKELKDIKYLYHTLQACLDKPGELEVWIKNNIANSDEEICKMSEGILKSRIRQSVEKIININRYADMVELKLLSAKQIRIRNSNLEKLQDINNEYIGHMFAAVKRYMIEAEKREETRIAQEKDDIYNRAMMKYNAGTLKEIEEAKKMFSSISNWRDVSEQLNECNLKIEKLNKKYNRNNRLIITGGIIFVLVLLVACLFIEPKKEITYTSENNIELCESLLGSKMSEKMSMSDQKRLINCIIGGVEGRTWKSTLIDSGDKARYINWEAKKTCSEDDFQNVVEALSKVYGNPSSTIYGAKKTWNESGFDVVCEFIYNDIVTVRWSLD